MDYKFVITTGVISTVLGGIILHLLGEITAKVKKSPRWVKDMIQIVYCIAVCIYGTWMASVNYKVNNANFIAGVALVIASSLALLLLFFAFRIAFDAMLKLSENLLETHKDNGSGARADHASDDLRINT